MTKTVQNVLMSGKSSFKIEVPHQLIESGAKRSKKPLLIYLHGYGQNIEDFQKQCELLLDIEAYHLFIQGPYPIYDRTGKKNVSEWGRAWYLYDGNRGQFIKSLEVTSEFIQEIVDRLINVIDVSRIGIVGYSMGGYLAGYFALTRWKHINDLAVCGARIKTEVLNGHWEKIKHLNIVAIHGEQDQSVHFTPQQEEIDRLKSQDINAEMVLLKEKHIFSEEYVKSLNEWLKKMGY